MFSERLGDCMKRIGILGGAFDPVHIGHLMMAERAADAFDLDQVVFVVAHQSPFKLNGNANAKHRLAMVKKAIAGNDRFKASDVEIKRGGVSYTIDTLEHFRKTYKGAELFLIIGEDNVQHLNRWKHIDAIRQMAKMIVIERDWFDVSSSMIRNCLDQKKSIRYLTTDTVVRYIKENHLYKKA